MSSAQPLARRLGLFDATMIGVGSMVGAGVFAVFAPAAGVAGRGLLVGLAIAGFVAYLNASSSAQLAAQYPASGGTYVYGRERLGEWPGFLAGWGFVIGKTASCAAMALTFAAYVAPPGWERPLAAAAVLALAAVNCFGITRTAAVTRVLVVVVLAVLVLVATLGFGHTGAGGPALTDGLFDAGGYGVLQSAGLLFFAFAGYARIATMGEEVRDPQRTIPRAILTALAIAFLVYATLAVVALTVLGPSALAASREPLVDVVTQAGSPWAVPVVRVGAAAAALGALLALIAGIGRTTLAMARAEDLPGWLSVVNARHQVPQRAELALAAIVVVLVLTTDLRGVIGFSSFGVLVYYAIANVSAATQDRAHRRMPRPFSVLGAVGCAALVVTLPFSAIAFGVLVFVAGVAYRLTRRRQTTRITP